MGQLTGCYTVEAVGEDKASARLITAARKKSWRAAGNGVVTQGGQDDNPSGRMAVERPVTISPSRDMECAGVLELYVQLQTPGPTQFTCSPP